MGFFTKKDKTKQPPPASWQPEKHRTRLHQKSSSLFEPPNVFIPQGHTAAHTFHVPPRPTSRSADRQRHGSRDQGRGHDHGPSSSAYHHRNASSPQLGKPVGYLPAPQGHPQPDYGHVYGPVVVNQHYYLNGQPPLPPRPQQGETVPSHPHPYENPVNFTGSMQNLARDVTALPNCSDGLSAWYGYSTNLWTSTVNACDEISGRLNHVLTLIDGENLKGHEMDLFACQAPTAITQSHDRRDRPADASKKAEDRRSKSRGRVRSYDKSKDRSKSGTADVTNAVIQGNYFSKVELYANARLPKDLTPFAVYMPTWPLLCLAAQYSLSVYERPSGAEREAHVSPDWRTGTKAMRIKSVPMDHMNTIVFAIRGTASFMDWAVNLNAAPTEPSGFLDDPGNLCHAGFLSVARRMVKPVATRLRQLLQEDPSRSRCSLLITGHSAGGAVASLLYSHMLAQSRKAQSELSLLTSSFKRVHCVTFGTPPLSLLPLTKPNRPELKNSLFLSFVNEGDPVVRADKGYVKSLLELLASPIPDSTPRTSTSSHRHGRHKSKPRKESRPTWEVPPAALSNSGRIVVLRNGRSHGRGRRHDARDRTTISERLEEGATAYVCDEEQLRGLVWGDPVAHLMKLYAGRIEMLAVQAVTVSKHRGG